MLRISTGILLKMAVIERFSVVESPGMRESVGRWVKVTD